MSTYEFWVLIIAVVALAISVVSAWYSKRSGCEAKRSADAAQAAHRLQLEPYVIAYAGTRKEQTQLRVRDRNAVCVENKGNGPAFNVVATIGCRLADGTDKRLELTYAALRPGERQEAVDGVPWEGQFEVWGVIECTDQGGNRYCLECARGQTTWAKVVCSPGGAT